MDLRSAVTEAGPKPFELAIQTRNLEQAQAIWPDATEADVGHIKMYFDPESPNEAYAARLAYEAAVHLGQRFYVLRDAEALEGELVPVGASWDDVLRLAAGPAAPSVEPPAASEAAPQPASAPRGRRSGVRRIEGVPRMSGG